MSGPEEKPTPPVTIEDLHRQLDELRAQVVPEFRIKSLIDERVSSTERDFTDKLSQIEQALNSKAAEDRAERGRIEESLKALSDKFRGFVESTEASNAHMRLDVGQVKTGVDDMKNSLSMLLTLINGRNEEVREIHADVNVLQAEVKQNRAELVRLDTDNGDFRYRVGSVLSILIGHNPYAPEETKNLEPLPNLVRQNALQIKDMDKLLKPLPDLVQQNSERIGNLDSLLANLNEPMERMLALKEQRDRLKTAIIQTVWGVVKSKWFWIALASSGALGPVGVAILSQISGN